MKILAVCGFGVGSSMVLKMSLDKVIKELGLKATVENTDLSTAKATMADVYFTSIICQIKRDKTFHLRNSKKLLMVFGNLVIF
ncbi:PTS sugar transporter subunit IIB [Enterococcus faecium]|nr:PTS sugar transporter subunit IIB [Enterococcus faecium]AOT77648.1 Ascorbate-specific phosphotransferase enzyme IIB component [Enterococcus faecium]EXG73604.1 hypothetical protein EFXG_03819 [Enterococcus faecium C68]PQG88263.1 PTS ascorbate transporter subunit IIB [Enterococcus faecium]ROX49293.1 PTS sugar transporter subunit IIB [Enterococcus faecium]ROY04742.1 PTS sugar transporter subunit IIB [Enterococcus faecium]